jgi:uncharacterized protein
VVVFVDTSTWYAAADSSDSSSARAKEVLTDASLVTSDHVLVETWLLIRHRLGNVAAERFWDGLRRGAAAVEPVEAADLEAAWRIGRAFEDQDFSIVDRTSFALMERLRLDTVASFDHDFAMYRYGPRRSRAFTVLR